MEGSTVLGEEKEEKRENRPLSPGSRFIFLMELLFWGNGRVIFSLDQLHDQVTVLILEGNMQLKEGSLVS